MGANSNNDDNDSDNDTDTNDNGDDDHQQMIISPTNLAGIHYLKDGRKWKGGERRRRGASELQ